MKPTVIANNTSGGGGGGASNGINIPINHEYGGHNTGSPQQQQQQPQYRSNVTQQQQPYAEATAYGSPNTHARQAKQQQQMPHPQSQQQPDSQQIPAHFQQGFGFEPDMDMDMDMFPRSRLSGRMHHDPFAGFGGTRKRTSIHDPISRANDDFSRYFDDDADFGFPQFGSMGRRRPGAAADGRADDHDFFNRLPSEFRQYIPDGFGHRRAGAAPMPQQQHYVHNPATPAGHQYYQQGYAAPPTAGAAQPPPNGAPQSPSKKVCDAAIQTEDLIGRSEVDCGAAPATHADNLNQHGLRNTVDMGVKSAAEGNEGHGPRSHSAPPPEQQQQNLQYQQQQQQQKSVNGEQNFATQTSPPVQGNYGSGGSGQYQGQPPQFQKAYYAPQQQSHPQQKQDTPPPPQTPGGTYIRTIPIFVEGRSDPIINAHKEIPNQYAAGNASAQASARSFSPQQQQQPQQQQHPYQQQPHQQQHRPTPLNTQQQSTQNLNAGTNNNLPPHTPHTLDSIQKIQDIQRDVLDLMTKVERFAGRRKDKEYIYLDEMLTRNLLKLDTIDTNGKESIRLARKEAIKCIQASINVLEAKAEENAKTAQGQLSAATATGDVPVTQESNSNENLNTTDAGTTADLTPATPQPVDATKLQEPIPLPAPPSTTTSDGSNLAQTNAESQAKEASPTPKQAADTQAELIANESK